MTTERTSVVRANRNPTRQQSTRAVVAHNFQYYMASGMAPEPFPSPKNDSRISVCNALDVCNFSWTDDVWVILPNGHLFRSSSSKKRRRHRGQGVLHIMDTYVCQMASPTNSL
jgi:hypothetical protein